MSFIKDKINQLSFEKKNQPNVVFDKKELRQIFNIYGRMVARGEWRDYGISMFKEASLFCIYRHTSENPIFTVKKVIKHKDKEKVYSLIAINGGILKKSNSLSSVLWSLELKLLRIVK